MSHKSTVTNEAYPQFASQGCHRNSGYSTLYMRKYTSELIEFDDMDIETVAGEVHKFSQTDGFDYVVTPNIDHLARLSDSSHSDSFAQTYKEAALTICDSMVFKLLSKVKGLHIENVVPGSTLTHYLFTNRITERDHVLIIGCDEQEICAVEERFRHLNIDHISPSMGFIDKPEELEEIIHKVEKLRANYIFLAVGSPQQERLAAHIKEHAKVGAVGLCIGGSIQFLAGSRTRAPRFVQKLALEWLFRLLQEPKRLASRYAKNLIAIPKIFRKL